MVTLDAHQSAPEDLKELYKRYKKTVLADLAEDKSIIDLEHDTNEKKTQGLKVVNSVDRSRVKFSLPLDDDDNGMAVNDPVSVFESIVLPGLYTFLPISLAIESNVPGLCFIPGLLSEDKQIGLLSRLLHRDLSDSRHLTNLHKHYTIPYDSISSLPGNADSTEKDNSMAIEESSAARYSFFRLAANSPCLLSPHDAAIHRPLTISQFLNKKLRWITLGGQFDWTTKQYPRDPPPLFPKDIANLIQNAFPKTTPEAAIVNIYSPGDTLSLHRDVSEASNQGLVSISIGCEAVFLAGLEGGSLPRAIAVRLRSGDAVYMTGASRYAWHGVPCIIPNSCPSWLRAWPDLSVLPAGSAAVDQQGTNLGCSGSFESWRDWMASKRINLNVRQMFDDA